MLKEDYADRKPIIGRPGGTAMSWHMPILLQVMVGTGSPPSGGGVASSETVNVLQILVTVIQALTFLALIWYTLETRAARINSANQMRLSIMPVLRVVLNRAPDKIILENLGHGIGSNVWLQGFRCTYKGGVIRCSFDPVNMLAPNKDAAPYPRITSEGTNIVFGGNMIYTAVGQALQARQPLVLSLHFSDIMGNSYRSDVQFTFATLMGVMARSGERPHMSNPMRVPVFPGSLAPVDAL